MSLIQIIIMGILFILFFAIIFLLKTGWLKEKYSVLWLTGIGIVLALTISRRLLEKVSLLFGVYYPPSFLFVLAFLVTLVILLHFSVAISQQEKKQKILAQRLVLLEERIKRMKKGETDEKQIIKDN